MTAAPIDLILARLPDAKPTGRDRWRAACPVCGERNKSTLSVGVGDNGAVLVKCFKSGCSPVEVAQALCLDLSDLFPPRAEAGQGAGPLKRRRLLSAGQCLQVIDFECLLVWTAAHNLAAGHALTVDDLARLDVAARRIQALAEEVRA